MAPSRPGLEVALLLALVASGGCATTAPVARAAPAPSFDLAPCTIDGTPETWAEENRVECGWLTVPESHGKRPTRTLKLWVAIARALEPSPGKPPLLYLQSGPGLPLVDLVVPWLGMSGAWTALRRHRDVIFLDQRGTGRSEPTFCASLNAELNALEGERPPADVAHARRRRALGTCRAELLGAGLDFGAYNSAATTEDAELLRRALGISRWSVYGVSYGAWIALEYLRRHAGSVNAAVLDSSFPPNTSFWADTSVAPLGRSLEEVERACAADPACRKSFPDLNGALRTALRRLDHSPLPGAGGRMDAAAFNRALSGLLLFTATVKFVPLAIHHAARGDDEVTRRFIQTFDSDGGSAAFSYGQALAVNCYESWAGPTAPALSTAKRRYPLLVLSDAAAEERDELCAIWQPERAPPETFAPVRSTTPVLLFAGQFDPISPLEDTIQAARLLSAATVVTVAGASHQPMGTDECTWSIASRFLEAPTERPDLGCLAQRPALQFATEGFDAFLRGAGAAE